MNKKFILWLSFVAVSSFTFTLQSCRTDEVVQEEKQTRREKIAAFERFENNLASKKLLQKEDLGYISYHEPFKDIIQAYMNNNPSFNQEFHDEAGDIYFDLRSFTYGETKKGLAYPIIKNGVVNAVLVGIVSPERDWVNFTVLKNNSPEVLQIISKFQSLYTASQLPKGREEMQEHEIEEVVITIYQSIPGPSYTYYQPYTDYGGNDGSGLGGSMSGGGSHYGGNGNSNNPPDPCEKALPSMTKANTVFKNSEVKAKMDAVLKGKINAQKEWNVAIGQAPNNGPTQVTNPVEGGDTNSQPPISQLNSGNTFIGNGHSHAGLPGDPSGGDIYAVLERLQTYRGISER